MRGLSRVVEPRRLTVIGNTGDDEQFFGLHVAPDLDTVLYTLAGRADPVRGSGLLGLKDRIEALGGTFSVHSPAGRGTTVTCELPVTVRVTPAVKRVAGCLGS